MDLSAADIFRQAIQTTSFSTMGREDVSTQTKAPVEKGAAMGFQAEVVSDPTADLMDSMEELSFQFEEKEMKTVGERKLGEANGPRSAYLQAIQSWMKAMPDMPGREFLERMLRMLRSGGTPPNAQEFLRMLGQGSSDPSHQFAMLDCLEQALAEGEAELRQLVRDAKSELERTQGPEMRAGINIAEEINARATSHEEMQGLRDMYRGEVLGFSTPQDCFKSLLASRGAGRLSESIDFLIASCGVDLQSPSPSQSPEELRRILLDLQCVEVLRTVLERFNGLEGRMASQFHETCLLNGEQMTGRVMDMTQQPFLNAATIGSFVTSCGIQALLAQMDFTRELVAAFRSLSPRLFSKDGDRFKMIDSAQEHLDHLVDLEEDEEDEGDEEGKGRR